VKKQEPTGNVIRFQEPVEEELDFEKIKEITKKANNTQITIKTLTDKEKSQLQVYMKDIARYINKYASQGKSKFEYDCAGLTVQAFMELATTFKENYPLFFVLIRFKQILVIDWSGKSEV
jgi:hypothetical protein